MAWRELHRDLLEGIWLSVCEAYLSSARAEDLSFFVSPSSLLLGNPFTIYCLLCLILAVHLLVIWALRVEVCLIICSLQALCWVKAAFAGFMLIEVTDALSFQVTSSLKWSECWWDIFPLMKSVR